jgi:histidyl-tRNA synthetase
MKLELPRGLRDVEPEEFDKIEWLREKYVETLRLFGFNIMEPSPIENLSTLERKSGSSIVNEIYFFKDKAARELGLRFDLTVGISRFVSSRRDLEFPMKIGAFSGVWRYDEPQHGRYRWFYQWDAEIYGRPCVEADAEIIDLATVFFEKTGLKDIQVELSDRKVVEEYITDIVGMGEEEKVSELLRMLDKTSKKSEEEIIQEYSAKGFSEGKLREVLSIAKVHGKPGDALRELEKMGLKKLDDLRDIVQELETRGISGFRINLGIVRGIDYYSGIVYEFYDTSLGRLAVAGGGRYDKLMQAFGRPDLSATGMAGGVERMVMAIEHNKKIERTIRQRVFVAYAKEGLKQKAQEITAKIRKRGYTTETDIYSRELRKQLAYASKHCNYVIIIAPKEDMEGFFILKNLKSGEEQKIAYNKILENKEGKLFLE